VTLRRTAALVVRSTWRQRRRAWPAASGIAIGVAAMVGMTAAGRGAEREVLARIRSMGSDLVVVTAGQVKLVAGRPRQLGNVTTLRAEDAAAVARGCPSVLRAAPAQSRRLSVKWGDTSTTTTVVGTTPDLLAIRNLAVADGRFFEDEEDRGALRVAVLGPTVVRNLFEDRAPLGETVRVDRVPFTVVGVLAPKGLDTAGNDQDDQIVVPVRTALRRLFNIDYVNNVFVQAASGAAGRALAQLREVLRERHRLRPGREDDFTAGVQADVLAAEADAASSFTLLLGAVSTVALLVGGVGVLAVMLIAVRERVREVGLRRALGATRRDIRNLFAGEALVVGAVGGAAGLALGSAAALLVAAAGALPVSLSPVAGGVAAVVSLAIALGFGTIPARRAAGLDPVESLRSA